MTDTKWPDESGGTVDILAIDGIDGSGKSTVARCIARLIDPSDGRILLHDTDIATMPATRLSARSVNSTPLR